MMDDVMVPADELNAGNFISEELLAAWVRPLIAEFFGAFALTFIGAGAIMTLAAYGNNLNDGGSILAIALAHGLAIGLMVAAAGHISGGHYNPAVTFGVWLGGKIGTLKSVGYVVVQLGGAVVAALILKSIYPEAVRNATALGTPTVSGVGSPFIVGRQNAFVIELVLTFFLMYVIYGTAIDKGGAHAIAGLAIGLSITMDIFMGGPLTGAAMNPSRFFGPALVQNHWDNGWIWFIAPLVGAGIAAISYNYILLPKGKGEPPAPEEHHADLV